MTDVQDNAQGTDDGAQGEPPAPMPNPGQAVSRRATFTVASAARECHVHEKTIRRKLSELAEHGAVLKPDGWVIPYEALRAIGLHPGQPTPPDAPVQDAHPGQQVTSRAVAQGVVSDDVQAELDTLRLRLELVEARAAQRLAEELLDAERRLTGEVIAALKQSVSVLQRQLESGINTTTGERPANPSAASTEAPDVAVEPRVETPRVTTPDVDPVSVVPEAPARRRSPGRWLKDIVGR